LGTIAGMTSSQLRGCLIVNGMPGSGKTTVTLVMLAPGLKVCQDRNAARDDDERLDFDRTDAARSIG
jgi:broad-specificity NMP kinase